MTKIILRSWCCLLMRPLAAFPIFIADGFHVKIFRCMKEYCENALGTWLPEKSRHCMCKYSHSLDFFLYAIITFEESCLLCHMLPAHGIYAGVTFSDDFSQVCNFLKAKGSLNFSYALVSSSEWEVTASLWFVYWAAVLHKPSLLLYHTCRASRSGHGSSTEPWLCSLVLTDK